MDSEIGVIAELVIKAPGVTCWGLWNGNPFFSSGVYLEVLTLLDTNRERVCLEVVGTTLDHEQATFKMKQTLEKALRRDGKVSFWLTVQSP